jgi:hypothetical protein
MDVHETIFILVLFRFGFVPCFVMAPDRISLLEERRKTIIEVTIC